MATPTLEDIFAVMAAAARGDSSARVSLPEDPDLDDLPTRFAVALNLLLDDLGTQLAESRDLQARKSAILESALDCYITMDASGRIVDFNPAAERVFGYHRGQALGQRLADLIIPPAFRQAHWAGLRRYLATGHGPVLGKRLELSALCADGTEIPIELAITTVDLPGPPLFTACIRDLTDRKRSEAERLDLENRVRLSERLDSLGQLAGGVAHDFNNLLGVILISATLLARRTAEDPLITADVEQIRAAAERGARLTRQLLIVGRREAISPEVLDLNAIVAELHDLLSRSIGEHIQITLHRDDALPTISADRGQIEQVLLNLAVNARDAMPGGGDLAIATRTTHVDDDYVCQSRHVAPGRYVEMTVTDTGVGMTRDVADHIFEPFFTTKPTGDGTGLGLATVYSIVAQAGGAISVYSEVGIGSTFRILLPAVDQPVSSAPKPTAASLRGHGEVIVLVEDEAPLLEVTARILRASGYAVLEASTGTEALALLAESDAHLLLTDSVMPHMSGRELAEQVRETRPELPVLFMSGYDDDAFGSRGSPDKAAKLLQKPFTAETLLARVRTAVSQTGMHRVEAPGNTSPE
jgi:two-component system cell cycle sensor histidine kinase/response regulator CckA